MGKKGNKAVLITLVGVAAIAGMMMFFNKYLYRSKAAGEDLTITATPKTGGATANQDTEITYILQPVGDTYKITGLDLTFNATGLTIKNVSAPVEYNTNRTGIYNEVKKDLSASKLSFAYITQKPLAEVPHIVTFKVTVSGAAGTGTLTMDKSVSEIVGNVATNAFNITTVDDVSLTFSGGGPSIKASLGSGNHATVGLPSPQIQAKVNENFDILFRLGDSTDNKGISAFKAVLRYDVTGTTGARIQCASVDDQYVLSAGFSRPDSNSQINNSAGTITLQYLASASTATNPPSADFIITCTIEEGAGAGHMTVDTAATQITGYGGGVYYQLVPQNVEVVGGTGSNVAECQTLLTKIQAAYDKSCGETGYDKIADVNKDRKVDFADTTLVGGNNTAAWCQARLSDSSDPCPNPACSTDSQCGPNGKCYTNECGCVEGKYDCDDVLANGCESDTVCNNSDVCFSAADCDSNSACTNGRCSCSTTTELDHYNCDNSWANGCESATPCETTTIDPTQPIATETPDPSAANLNISLRLQGISGLFTPTSNTFSARLKLVDSTEAYSQSKNATFTYAGQGKWTSSVSFSGISAAKKYKVFVKGPRQLQKRICDASPSESYPGSYRCETAKLTLIPGNNDLDFSRILLLGGDLPDQDGIITAYDISLIVNNLGKPATGELVNADINLDGQINTLDYSLLIASLGVKYDEGE